MDDSSEAHEITFSIQDMRLDKDEQFVCYPGEEWIMVLGTPEEAFRWIVDNVPRPDRHWFSVVAWPPADGPLAIYNIDGEDCEYLSLSGM